MDIPKSLFEGLENPSISQLIDNGNLQKGDKLYTCMAGLVMEVTFEGLTDDGYVNLVGEDGKSFRTILSDERFNKFKELSIVSTINQVKRLIRNYERDLMDYRNLLKKLNVSIID